MSKKKREYAWIAWGIGLGVLAWGLCVPLAGLGWVFDLGSNLGGLGLLLGGGAGIWMAWRRRWGALTAALVGCVMLGWFTVVGPAPGQVSGGPVRVLVFNSSGGEGDALRAMGVIEGSGADVVVLTEPSAALLDLVRESATLRVRYPARWLPDRARGGFLVVLSAWGQTPLLGDRAADVARGGLRAMRIERPRGSFVLIAIHPDSPRTPAEWARGNGRVREAIGVARGLEGPVVVAADMNSTPSGWRSRAMEGAGLIRARPRIAAGTYPAWLPGVARIAIDDVWARGCGVAEWEAMDGGGSDHAPVLVSVVVPDGQAAGPPGR